MLLNPILLREENETILQEKGASPPGGEAFLQGGGVCLQGGGVGLHEEKGVYHQGGGGARLEGEASRPRDDMVLLGKDLCHL